MTLIFEKLSFSALFTQLLNKRGLLDPETMEAFFNFEPNRLGDPFLMKGMKEASARIQRAIANREKILIHGDYDVDGITGTAIVAATLERFGANFSTFLPDRKADGYGVSEDAIRRGKQSGVSLLITVDCGIAAHREMEIARTLGVDVLIIDHHRISAQGIPCANIVLNPLQEDCSYPFKELSAGGLAFKLAQTLLGTAAYELMDLAAISTICDVAPLTGENRIIVKNGLDLLSGGKRLGMKSLTAISGLKAKSINAGHVGFILGPRINAAGRMSSPEIALRLLMTLNQREAESLAQVLNEENKARQKEERQVVREAINEVERSFNFNRDRIIVVGREGWHAGVIGIVASRLVERFGRPAFVISFEKETGKGSGRSIHGFNLFKALESCKACLEEFGGHAQAAGLVIQKKNLESFRQTVNQYAREHFDTNLLVREIETDLEIELKDLRSHFLNELKLLEPHGAGNPRPIFHTKSVEVRSAPHPIAAEFVKVALTDGSVTAEAEFHGSLAEKAISLRKGRSIGVSYTVKTKVWEGVETIILDVKALTPLP